MFQIFKFEITGCKEVLNLPGIGITFLCNKFLDYLESPPATPTLWSFFAHSVELLTPVAM